LLDVERPGFRTKPGTFTRRLSSLSALHCRKTGAGSRCIIGKTGSVGLSSHLCVAGGPEPRLRCRGVECAGLGNLDRGYTQSRRERAMQSEVTRLPRRDWRRGYLEG